MSWPGAASGMSRSPPTTSDSLLASARRLPAVRAAWLASRPAAPTMATSTQSTSSRRARSQVASAPNASSHPLGSSESTGSCACSGSETATARTLNSRAADTRASVLELTESATTSRLSACCRQTSSACVPIDPEQPRMAMRSGFASTTEERLPRAGAGTPRCTRRSASRNDRACRRGRE